MVQRISQRIEFFGGPMDGHVERFATAPKSFVLVATEALTPKTSPWVMLFRVLVFHEQIESRLGAVYELHCCDGQLRYHYMCSNIEMNAELEGDDVETLAQ